MTTFWTTEQADNEAILQGVVVERSTVVPDAGTTLLLLGVSLTGLAAMRKRLS